MIRAPHHPGSLGTRVTAIVEIIDIMPTLIALAGLPPLDPSIKGEPDLEGRSLEPLLASTWRQGRGILGFGFVLTHFSRGAQLHAAPRTMCAIARQRFSAHVCPS